MGVQFPGEMRGRFWADSPTHVCCAHLLPTMRPITTLLHRHYTPMSTVWISVPNLCHKEKNILSLVPFLSRQLVRWRRMCPGVACGWQALLRSACLLRWFLFLSPPSNQRVGFRNRASLFCPLLKDLTPCHVHFLLSAMTTPNPPFQKTLPFSPFSKHPLLPSPKSRQNSMKTLCVTLKSLLFQEGK